MAEFVDPVPSFERIRVRYGETDQMGHAYYANYLYWFEQARGTWIRERGFSYKSFEEERQLFLPVVETGVRYRGEVHYDDIVSVKVWMSEMTRAAIKFEYEITNETSGKLTTTGFTWHVFMGPDRKAVSIPEDLRHLLSQPPNLRPGPANQTSEHPQP